MYHYKRHTIKPMPIDHSTPIQENISLQPYNTFGIQASAKWFTTVTNQAQLQQLLSDQHYQTMPKLILGGGSNVLFTQDYPGLVIKNNIPGINKLDEDNDYVWLKIGAGEDWHQLVMHCVDNNYGGIENLSLIPGTVGAAPMQNIGAYGVELKDVFHELTAINIDNGTARIFKNIDCQFAYRSSVFKTIYKNQFIITNITLRLQKQPTPNISYDALARMLSQMQVQQPTIKEVSDVVIQIRQSKLPDPKEIGNAGSFFKNPEITTAELDQLQTQFETVPFYSTNTDKVKIPAAWLIEKCGFKGKRFGNIGVHEKQALVIVNYGDGVGEDIKNLSETIQQAVQDKFNILLTPEVNII